MKVIYLKIDFHFLLALQNVSIREAVLQAPPVSMALQMMWDGAAKGLIGAYKKPVSRFLPLMMRTASSRSFPRTLFLVLIGLYLHCLREGIQRTEEMNCIRLDKKSPASGPPLGVQNCVEQSRSSGGRSHDGEWNCVGVLKFLKSWRDFSEHGSWRLIGDISGVRTGNQYETRALG